MDHDDTELLQERVKASVEKTDQDQMKATADAKIDVELVKAEEDDSRKGMQN